MYSEFLGFTLEVGKIEGLRLEATEKNKRIPGKDVSETNTL